MSAAEKLKVLIVDDAVLARKVMSDVIGAEPDMEVVATASNGRLAMQRISVSMPDIIILDVEMPDMNGLETIEAVRKLSQSVPIVMFSAVTEKGARETFDALARGANDYVAKPASQGGLAEAKKQIREELIPKLRALFNQSKSGVPGKVPAAPCKPEPIPSVKINAIAIGVSTGGPNALSELIPALPENLSVPVLLTQHMPALFTRLLAERLNQQSKVRVHEAAEGDVIESGCVYIAPGGHHLTVTRKDSKVMAALSDAPPENSCRPAVDVMIRSMVQVYGKHILSVILTGMGQDGLLGVTLVRQTGGIVLAQDEASSVVWGMPGAVTRAGVAHAVLPLKELPQAIVNFVSRSCSEIDEGKRGVMR